MQASGASAVEWRGKDVRVGGLLRVYWMQHKVMENFFLTGEKHGSLSNMVEALQFLFNLQVIRSLVNPQRSQTRTRVLRDQKEKRLSKANFCVKLFSYSTSDKKFWGLKGRMNIV